METINVTSIQLEAITIKTFFTHDVSSELSSEFDCFGLIILMVCLSLSALRTSKISVLQSLRMNNI